MNNIRKLMEAVSNITESPIPRENTEALLDVTRDGALDAMRVLLMALNWMGEDSVREMMDEHDLIFRENIESTSRGPSPYTNHLLELVEEDIVNLDHAMVTALYWLDEAEVTEMMNANDIVDLNYDPDEEDLDEAESTGVQPNQQLTDTELFALLVDIEDAEAINFILDRLAPQQWASRMNDNLKKLGGNIRVIDVNMRGPERMWTVQAEAVDIADALLRRGKRSGPDRSMDEGLVRRGKRSAASGYKQWSPAEPVLAIMKNRKCVNCKKGTYEYQTPQDEWHGNLNCTKCRHNVEYEVELEKKGNKSTFKDRGGFTHQFKEETQLGEGATSAPRGSVGLQKAGQKAVRATKDKNKATKSGTNTSVHLLSNGWERIHVEETPHVRDELYAKAENLASRKDAKYHLLRSVRDTKNNTHTWAHGISLSPEDTPKVHGRGNWHDSLIKHLEKNKLNEETQLDESRKGFTYVSDAVGYRIEDGLVFLDFSNSYELMAVTLDDLESLMQLIQTEIKNNDRSF